jgi:NADPH:quinone reductase-like Zn-dependent oxidoreductase
MSSPRSAFRRWQYTSTKGGLEANLKLNEITPLPTPKPNQHLVEILYAALNPVDYKPAEVPIAGRLIVPNPATPGLDFAGRIVTPATDSSLKKGQLVFGVTSITPFAGGALSEYACTEREGVVALPEGVAPLDAATIGVAGLTAYQAIIPRVKKGDKVFINGGSGGCGVFGVQIAKASGCFVATSCSTANVELCKSLGADLVVDYRKQGVVDALVASGHTFDLVVDNVGSDLELYWRCHEYTSPKAVYMMIAGTPSLGHIVDIIKVKTWPGFLGGGKRKQEGFLAKPNNDDLEQLGSLMKEGKMKAVIDHKFAYEDAPKAFEKLKTGRAKGKIVINVAGEI